MHLLCKHTDRALHRYYMFRHHLHRPQGVLHNDLEPIKMQ